MSVSFRSSSTVGSTGNISITKPTGTSSGDLLFVNILTQEVTRSDSAIITPDQSWTDVFTGESLLSGTYQMVIDLGSGLRWFWYVGYRVAGGSEPSSYTFTTHNANPALHGLIDGAGAIVCYQNPDATTPIPVVGTPGSPVLGGSGVNVGSITPGETGTLIVNLIAYAENSNGWSIPNDETITAVDDSYSTPNATVLTVGAPGVKTNDLYTPGHEPHNRRADVINGAASNVVGATDYPWDPATATGSIAFTQSGSNDFASAVSFALRGSLDDQTDEGDLVVSLFGASPFFSLTLNADGSFVYDPSTFYGVKTFQYDLTSPNGGTDRALVTIHVGYPPVVFADAILRSETSAGAAGTPAGDPVFAGDTLFLAE